MSALFCLYVQRLGRAGYPYFFHIKKIYKSKNNIIINLQNQSKTEKRFIAGEFSVI